VTSFLLGAVSTDRHIEKRKTPSAAWQPRHQTVAHGFASRPHDRFAFIGDDLAQNRLVEMCLKKRYVDIQVESNDSPNEISKGELFFFLLSFCITYCALVRVQKNKMVDRESVE
jgi:hypothetical protein